MELGAQKSVNVVVFPRYLPTYNGQILAGYLKLSWLAHLHK